MVRIVTVCGMGLGSGLMARMTVERILKRNGVLDSQYSVEVSDLNSAKQADVDIYVTNHEFAQSIEGWTNCLVVVKNIFDEKEVEQSLMPVFKEVASKLKNK